MPDEDQLFFHPIDPPIGTGIGARPSTIAHDLDLIKRQLAQLPTRNEVWRAAMLGMLGGAVAAVTLIEALFSQACH